MESLFAKMRSGEIERDKIREHMEGFRKEAESMIMDILTSEQKSKLEELKGDKFEFDRSQLFQRRGGRDGQRPGGDRPGNRPGQPSEDSKPSEGDGV